MVKIVVLSTFITAFITVCNCIPFAVTDFPIDLCETSKKTCGDGYQCKSVTRLYKETFERRIWKQTARCIAKAANSSNIHGVNECNGLTNTCQENKFCFPSIGGGHRCMDCYDIAGISPDQFICTYDRNNGGCNCNPIDFCETKKLKCAEGLQCKSVTTYDETLSGRVWKQSANCEDVNECELKTDNCNHSLELCVNNVGSFECKDCYSIKRKNALFYKCYVVDGECVCDDIDECQNDVKPCKAEETCVNKDGGYRCDAAAYVPPKTCTDRQLSGFDDYCGTLLHSQNYKCTVAPHCNFFNSRFNFKDICCQSCATLQDRVEEMKNDCPDLTIVFHEESKMYIYEEHADRWE